MADEKPPDSPTPGGAASTAPFWLLVASLLGLAAFFLLRPLLQDEAAFRPRHGGRTYDYWPLVLAAFVPYGLAIRASLRGMRMRPEVLLGAVAAVAVAFVPAPPQQSQDVYQYLVYGEMATRGMSPYGSLPSDLGSAWLAYSSWPDTASVYGPAWTALSQFAVTVGGTLTGALLVVKALAGGLWVATAAGMARAAVVDPARPAWASSTFAVVVFALNPLVAVSTGLGAHADIAIAGAFAWAVVAERRGRVILTTVLLAAAALVKPYAGIALLVWFAALWRRRGAGAALKHASGAAAGAVVAFAPYWEGADTFRGLTEIGTRASASLVGSLIRLAAGDPDSANAGMSAAGTAGRMLALGVVAAGLVWAFASRRTARDPWRAAAVVSALYVLLTPWYLYWHLLGAFALAILAADAALVAAAAMFGATSLVVIAPPLSTGGVVPDLLAQTAARYGPPLALWARVRRRYTRGRERQGRDTR